MPRQATRKTRNKPLLGRDNYSLSESAGGLNSTHRFTKTGGRLKMVSSNAGLSISSGQPA